MSNNSGRYRQGPRGKSPFQYAAAICAWTRGKSDTPHCREMGSGYWHWCQKWGFLCSKFNWFLKFHGFPKLYPDFWEFYGFGGSFSGFLRFSFRVWIFLGFVTFLGWTQKFPYFSSIEAKNSTKPLIACLHVELHFLELGSNWGQDQLQGELGCLVRILVRQTERCRNWCLEPL